MAERTAGIVLAGGRSERMGSPKATLEWHGSTLVRRAVGLVARAVDGPVVVVRARGQELPPLPDDVELATDRRDGRGPLQGIAAGVQRIGDRADVAFVTGVDAPLLHPAFVAHVLRALRPADDVALPRSGGFDHPLAAAYRLGALAPALDAQLASGDLKTRSLVAGLRVHALDEAALLAGIGGLDSLLNLNTRAEYEAARAKPAPRVTVRADATSPPLAVEAATLGQAAAAAGVTLGPGVVATLVGHGPIADPHEPLAGGDALTFATQATSA